MDRTTKVAFSFNTLLGRLRTVRSAISSITVIACWALALSCAISLHAQQGDGAIQGTVADKSGAVIPRAKVTVINTSTGVRVTRITNNAGDYTVTPLQAGHYRVEVEAKSFEKLVQENVTVDSLEVLGLNLSLSVGAESATITVTDAPEPLNTTGADLGGTIENELYTELPLSMGGAPRDPTAFAFLMPGVQEGGGNTGVYGGSGQEYLNENYIDGVPQSSAAGQGDPTVVRSSVSVDAVDQFQVKTNGASTGFGGVGVTNYTMKAGGNTMHGTVFDYVRNTAFDTWGYFSKVPLANGIAIKPAEHQNSYGGSLGGPILKDKLFYFGTYEGFYYTKISNTPEYLTVPTMRERAGDFTDAFGANKAVAGSGNYGIFDPTQGTTRNQFDGLLNGVPTWNVIPQNEISSISQYLAAGLPQPTNLSIYNNYLAGLPLENKNYTIDTRLDYTINANNKLAIVGMGGVVGYGTLPKYSSQNEIPFPYAAGLYIAKKTSTGVITYTYVASQNMINSLKYGVSRTWGNGFAPSDGTKWTAAAAGIGNLPSGSASNTFPGVTFSGGSTSAEVSPSSWGSNVDTGPQATTNFTIIDNLTWMHGRHNFTFGAQVQWLQTNAASYGGFSGPTALTYDGYDTEDTNALTGGSAYASFLIGAVYAGNVRTQTIVDSGGRYRPIAPYIQDSWRVTSKMTVNLGLRYDYLEPYHEGNNRIAWVTGSKINPIVGIPGVIEYAGYGQGPNPSFADYVCQCKTPVRPYKKNFEPRLSLAYSIHQNTVFRAGFGIMTTHAGGTGGHANATFGPGNNAEFAQTVVWSQVAATGTSSTSPPAFFLNPSIPGSAINSQYGVGNANGQTDYASLPPWKAAGVNVNPLSTTGNYLLTKANAADCAQPDATNTYCGNGTQNYVDPYYGGRGPQFVNYNAGIQQMINKKAVLSIDYAGSQTHFLPGGAGRGYATNGISPDYGPLLGLNLNDTVSAANLTAVQAILPGFNWPYSNYAGTGATVARALSAFPQYNGFTDIWGATGNSSYNALQVALIQRAWHGISGFVNYTWSKSMDDTGNHRTQYPVGPQDGNFAKVIPANKVDRSLGTFDQRQAFNATAVYILPFGKGQALLANNRLASMIAGGWQLSGILKLREGSPLQITSSYVCGIHEYGLQGTCMPDYVPGFGAKNARINGKWGRAPGANASNIQTIQYLNPAAFQCPNLNCSESTSFTLGNVARSAPYGITGPGWKDLDLGIRRTFQVRETASYHVTFQLEADVINATNSTYFTLASGATGWGTCAAGATVQSCSAANYGTIGGQNSAVPPRDWQFAGRFRF